MTNDLSLATSNSISEEVRDLASEFVELGLDSVLDDGLVKDIPIVSTAIGLYKLGTGLKDRHYLKKLAVFVNELNAGTASEEKREYYKKRLIEDSKTRDNELEFILVLIDRYLSLEKPAMLAKLYLAYLDGEITWEEFSAYAQIIEGLLPEDYNALKGGSQKSTDRASYSVSLLRLSAIGLYYNSGKDSLFSNDGRGGVVMLGSSINSVAMGKVYYERTPFGDKLAEII